MGTNATGENRHIRHEVNGKTAYLGFDYRAKASIIYCDIGFYILIIEQILQETMEPHNEQAQSRIAKPMCAPVSVSNLEAVHEDELLAAQILIFDDQEFGAPYKAELKKFGFRSISITNNLEVLKSTISDSKVNLLVVACAKLTDNEVCEVIRKCTADAEICVLAASGTEDSKFKKLALDIGVDDFLPSSKDSIELIARTRNSLKSKLANQHLAQYSEQLRTDVLIDPLTNIANRRAFDFELNRKMIEWQRNRSPVALFMIDIDFFKKFNDAHGHQAGDAVLAMVAGSIEDTLREMDLLCRFGGEEFAAIVPIRRAQESTQTAERIRRAIELSSFQFEGKTLKVTVSVGVAEVMNGDDQELILKRADTALYESKQNGRNRVTFHDGARCAAIQRSGDGEPIAPQQDFSKIWTINDEVFNLCSSNILIVDDSEVVTKTIRAYLDRGGFQNLFCETNPLRVEKYFESSPPDLVLLDIEMPELDGLTILRRIRSEECFNGIPIIIVTAHNDSEVKNRALELGCNDFLLKPVIGSEILARVSNTLLSNAHTKFLAGYANRMEQEVKVRTAELIASRREAIQCLARAAEINDDETGYHIIRVGKYAALIAEEMGFTDTQVIEIEHAAQLHDVGKIDIPQSILKKRDRLTQEEFDIVKSHCNKGGSMIRDDQTNESTNQNDICSFLLNNCSSSVMRMAAIVAESHHEKWDGSGYPHGFRAENIPIEGRIVAVCDVFDAVSNSNAYREAFDLEKCFEIVREGAGKHFDPSVVDAFFRRKDEVIQVFQDFRSEQPTVVGV